MVDSLSQAGFYPDSLVIPAVLVEQMRRHVAESVPHEACGLVGGLNGIARVVYPITNLVRSPVRFQMDPSEQLAAFESMETQGWELLAIYHSHPNGPPTPSPTDIAEAYYPEAAHLIWRSQPSGWRPRAFSIQQGKVREICLLEG